MRRPKKTVTINLGDYLSAGTYNVKVKSKGTDIRDSADSNSAECVVAASGYSGNISALLENDGLNQTTYIKFDSAPTSLNDYDFVCDVGGEIRDRDNTPAYTSTYTNKTKVYVWTSSAGGVIINGTHTRVDVRNLYNNAVEVALTGNYDITMVCSTVSGGGSGL